MGRPLLGRDANPRQADDEENLGEREIGDAELFPQPGFRISDQG